MFTASGLIVRFLKVFEKNNYQSIKWVRYLTKASGSYQIRVRPRICASCATDSMIYYSSERVVFTPCFCRPRFWYTGLCFIHVLRIYYLVGSGFIEVASQLGLTGACGRVKMNVII